MFRVAVDRSGDVAVLQCRGRIVRGDATYILRDAVAAQRNTRIIVLDLSEVGALDGSGLGMLVSLHRWTRDNSVQLKLTNPAPLVQEMLERTRLTKVLDVSSMEEALTILESPVSPHRAWAVAS
jgi:anti-anti-sigma factor